MTTTAITREVAEAYWRNVTSPGCCHGIDMQRDPPSAAWVVHCPVCHKMSALDDKTLYAWTHDERRAGPTNRSLNEWKEHNRALNMPADVEAIPTAAPRDDANHVCPHCGGPACMLLTSIDCPRCGRMGA